MRLLGATAPSLPRADEGTIVGNPITFLGPDGKQYIAIYSGIGGWMGAVAFPDVSTDDEYAALGVVGAMKKIKNYTAPGGQIYVFGL